MLIRKFERQNRYVKVIQAQEAKNAANAATRAMNSRTAYHSAAGSQPGSRVAGRGKLSGREMPGRVRGEENQLSKMGIAGPSTKGLWTSVAVFT
jgi:hypothetical protein